ncbi:uncharacterized protein LOC143280823 [Babylonia areolata]|uniref:uncharacterized protein LOC143280823 n=1 Tax=Babylonia areolata TaxID=304850 RepID=UPI003FCF4870
MMLMLMKHSVGGRKRQTPQPQSYPHPHPHKEPKTSRQWRGDDSDEGGRVMVTRGRSPHLSLLTLIMLVLILPGGVQPCVRAVQEGAGGCPGGRPPSPPNSGCCPAGPGEECEGETEVGCDTELGFRCVVVGEVDRAEDGGDVNNNNVTTTAPQQTGICTGLYNLHVTDTGTNSVSLAWDDYKPPNYYFEYVLLFRKGSFSDDTDSWTLWDIGTQPHYTVTRLSPDTLYFMRLALWLDARATVLGNMSEVVMVVTQPATHCTHQGMTYPVGHVEDNCEDRCTCTSQGHMDCAPSCPPETLPDAPEGCFLEFEEECSCSATVVCPPPEREGTRAPWGSCEYKGLNYTFGYSWTDPADCLLCVCAAGDVICHSLCSEEQVVVPEGCTNPRNGTDPHGCCPLVVCHSTDSVVPSEEDEGCQHNGTTHHVGSTFTWDCSLCVCSPGNLLNCSSSACPVPELPLPNIFCPFPHVRRQGCCDIVFCSHNNTDPQVLLSRMMALSFGPGSLTISFDVDHDPQPVTQDRYEVMTSDGEGGADSWTSRTYTPTVMNDDDNVTSPLDLMYADAAIRVDDRVFITLDDLRPNTTYYVRVEPLVKRDIGGTGSSSLHHHHPSNTSPSPSLIGFFVARTMGGGGGADASCLVGDVSYQNGDVITDNCQEVCRCVSGDVICRRACPEEEEQLVMVPSASCPRPQLVPSDGESCCKAWRCFPEDDGCVYKGTFLRNGEPVYEGGCGGRRCQCTKGEVTCTQLCPPVSTAPRSECTLINVTSSCCPVWMCPQETKSPVGMSLIIQTGFHGDCSRKNDTVLQTSVGKAFDAGIQSHLPCADRESPFFVSCWLNHVMVMCPPHAGGDRKRRQTARIKVVAFIAANITASNSVQKVGTSLNHTQTALASLFSASRFPLPLDSGVNVTSSGTFRVLAISHLCPDAFVYQRNICVPEYLHPPSSLPWHQNVTMTVTATSLHSAAFTWPPLRSRPDVTAVVIQLEVTSSSGWSRTVTLDPMTTNHTIGNLLMSQQYTARLVALTVSSTSLFDVLTLATVPFSTASQEAFTLDRLQVTLAVTSVTLSWPALPSDVMTAISCLTISYRRSVDDDSEGRVIDLDPHASHVTLTELEAGQVYVSRFEVCLANGTTVTMAPLQFVTRAAEKSGVPVVPVLATCAVLLLLAILIPVVFFVWRRMRRKSGPETAFENRTYGVNISALCNARAKNDCARPQDTDSASAAASSDGSTDCSLQA